MVKKCADSNGKDVITMIIADYKMKFEPISARETTLDHYGKRGISWYLYRLHRSFLLSHLLFYKVIMLRLITTSLCYVQFRSLMQSMHLIKSVLLSSFILRPRMAKPSWMLIMLDVINTFVVSCPKLKPTTLLRSTHHYH